MSAFKLFGRKDRQSDDDDTIVTEGLADLLGEIKIDPTLPLPLGKRNWTGDDDELRAEETDGPESVDRSNDTDPGGLPHAEFPLQGEEIELAAPIEFPIGVPSEAPATIPAKDMEKADSGDIVIVDDDSDLVSLGTDFGITTSSLSIIPEEEPAELPHQEEAPDTTLGETVPIDGGATRPMAVPPTHESDRVLMAPFRLELEGDMPTPEESIASSLASIAKSIADMRDDIHAIRQKLCDANSTNELTESSGNRELPEDMPAGDDSDSHGADNAIESDALAMDTDEQTNTSAEIANGAAGGSEQETAEFPSDVEAEEEEEQNRPVDITE